MNDLVAFLRTRLDEDEAVAKACESSPPWCPAADESDSWIITDGIGRVLVYDEGTPPLADARHMARHDPARILREVEAKRKILAGIVPLIDRMDAQIEAEWGTATGPTGESDKLLKILAAVYSDHPDFRPEWAPAEA